MKRALFILGRAGGRKTEDAAALNRPAFGGAGVRRISPFAGDTGRLCPRPHTGRASVCLPGASGWFRRPA